ncbi:ABC transporter ATP-binding protein [Alkaliphilus transvaalensis]|uniref:ABC transporter ATP-binding protein n=1 Tax=Alkaliphilus transvaalensis TaxID=114628 RepID=UPI00047B3DBF|nr:ABC transporter ATP-binding protein [Alkaliphilus transvaalensis]
MKRLEVNGLYSGYEKVEVLKDVSIEINSGEIVGLIGSNGAGKTTLLKTILGIIPPTEGKLIVEGVEIDQDWNQAKGKIAYIPEMPLLYEELTLLEHLEFTAMANGVDKNVFEKRISRLLDTFNMRDKLHHFPNSFSKGMRQKVMVMCGLLYDPTLFVVDEPFIGLDPKSIKALVNILKEKRTQGLGILMSTHVLDAAERICDRFIVLSGGRVLYQGTLEEMRRDSKMYEADLMDLFDYFVEEVV